MKRLQLVPVRKVFEQSHTSVIMNEGFKNVGKVTPALKVTQSLWNSDRIPSSRTLAVTLLGGWFPHVSHGLSTAQWQAGTLATQIQ